MKMEETNVHLIEECRRGNRTAQLALYKQFAQRLYVACLRICLLYTSLQAKGYVTDLFSDGEAGYKGFTKGKYDLCVLDVMMPKKDGFTPVSYTHLT